MCLKAEFFPFIDMPLIFGFYYSWEQYCEKNPEVYIFPFNMIRGKKYEGGCNILIFIPYYWWFVKLCSLAYFLFTGGRGWCENESGWIRFLHRGKKYGFHGRGGVKKMVSVEYIDPWREMHNCRGTKRKLQDHDQ